MVRFIPQITFHTQMKTVIAKIKNIVGLAASHGRTIKANEIIGSALDPAAQLSKTVLTVKTLLSPLANEEVKVVRCLGLNYSDHAVSLFFYLLLMNCFVKDMDFLAFRLKPKWLFQRMYNAHPNLLFINYKITQIPYPILQTRHNSHRTPSHHCHPQSCSTT